MVAFSWSGRCQFQLLFTVDARFAVQGRHIRLADGLGVKARVAEGGIGKQLRVVRAIGVTAHGEGISIASGHVVFAGSFLARCQLTVEVKLGFLAVPYANRVVPAVWVNLHARLLIAGTDMDDERQFIFIQRQCEPAGFFVGTQALFAGKFAVEFESALDCEAIGKRCVLVPDIKLHGIILAVKGSNRLLQRRVDAKIRIPADFGRNIPRGVDGPGFRNFNIEQICLRVLLSMGRPYHGNVAYGHRAGDD